MQPCVVCSRVSIGKCCNTGFYCGVRCQKADSLAGHKCTEVAAPRGRRFRGLTKWDVAMKELFSSLFAYADATVAIAVYRASPNHENMKSWIAALKKQADTANKVEKSVETFESMLKVIDQPALADDVETRMRQFAWAVITFIDEVSGPSPSRRERYTDEMSIQLLNSVFKAMELDTTDKEALSFTDKWISLQGEGLKNAVQRYTEEIVKAEPWADRTKFKNGYIEMAKTAGETLDMYYKEKKSES